MKKLFFVCALCALCSCTSESFIDIEVPEVQEVQKFRFDKDEEFFSICQKIISANKDFDYFRAVLPKHLLKKIDRGNYNIGEAVEIIWLWYNNGDCFDVMCEMPEWDDFLPNLPDKYFEKYHWEY